MPVDLLHPSVSYALPSWTLVRDCIVGERAIKGRGDVYLPRLKDQSEAEYQAYKYRARFYGATGRTLKAFVGFIFSKDPEFEDKGFLQSAQADDFMNDADLSGVTWYDYCKNRVRDALGPGRSGTLIDWNMLPENRAYACFYAAEDITNWKTARINGRTVLTLLVLHEKRDATDPQIAAVGDEFGHAQEDFWRVYRLLFDDAGQPYVYFEEYKRTQKAKRKTAGGPAKVVRSARGTKLVSMVDDGEFDLTKQQYMERRGLPVRRIPFVFHNSLDGSPEVGPVPLEDIAVLNVSHYMTTADLEHGRHFCGLPTPIAAGFNVKGNEKLWVGSTRAWVADKSDAKAYYLEFSGQGLTALENAIKEKQAQMASLGARMLESQGQTARGNVEAFETVQIRQSAETSALRDVTLAMSASLSRVMQWVAWFHGVALQPEDLEETCYTRLNTDFISNKIDAPTLAQVWAGYQSGAYSFEEMFYVLQKGEMIRDDTTIEAYRTQLENSPIATMGTLATPTPKTGPAAGGAGDGGTA
jgi:hypothetical protein